jgi:hypothetical protein
MKEHIYAVPRRSIEIFMETLHIAATRVGAREISVRRTAVC